MQNTIIPVLPRLPLYCANPWLFICQCLAVLAITIIVALIIAKYAAHRWHGDAETTKCGFAGISVAYAVLLLAYFGFTLHTIRGILLCLILLFASYSDLKSREVDDYVSVMILLTAFISCSMAQLPGMLTAGLFTASIMLIVALSGRESCIGGADIKLGGACAFALGITGSITGLITGLILAIIVNSCRGKNARKQSFPMVPYLTAGFQHLWQISWSRWKLHQKLSVVWP